MAAIFVEGLAKSYVYYQKEAGLKSSLKNLVRREKLVREAVKGIGFEIAEGEVVGFLGPNGAGKTTTLKMLAGILMPTGGQARVLGYRPWDRKKEFKRRISIVMGQKSQLWWDLPANESFLLNRYIYELDGKEYEATLAELSELLEVKGLLGVQVRRLSLGERMKMELIAALIHRPSVLFLDEPTIGLDIVSQRKLRAFLRHHCETTRTTVLLTSHYMDDIEDLCRRTVIINDGRLVYDGELANVNAVFSGKKTIRVQLSQAVDAGDLARYGAVRSFDGFNATLEVDRQEIKEICVGMLNCLPVVDFNIENIPVEEGIMRLYGKEAAGEALP